MIAEIIVVVLLMWSNKVVASPQWAADNQTWPTTLWASNPTISAALQFGPVGGMLTGLVVMATNFAVKNYLTLNLGHNATIVIELSIGLAIGMAARTARRAHDELQRAAQLSAALEERERLSRQVHDGVIQVLALVAKRGHEIGGATSDLADLASEQERALRRWLSSATVDRDGDQAIDLRGAAAPPGVRPRVHEPARNRGDAGTAGRRRAGRRGGQCPGQRALARGADARAFVLLEDLGDSVAVSVRDDGVGHPGRTAGRGGPSRTPRHLEVDRGQVGVVGRHRTTAHRPRGRHRMGAVRAASKMENMPERALPTVMVVDDHPIWRDAVARDLADDGFDVVATADGVAAARRRAAVVKPDVVLMDMQLSDGTGVQATTEVLAVSPSSRVLVLSASDERDDVLEAVKAGATGYLVKSASKAELGEAVRATAAGRAVFTPSLAGLVLGEYRRIAHSSDDGPVRPSLTERETEVLRYVAKGLSAKQIAEKLSLSHRTVENHIQATFRKLQVANRVELTRYAIEHGLDE